MKCVPRVEQTHASQPDGLPQMNGGNGTNEEPKRTESLPSRKCGIACTRSLAEREDLDGNGVTIVPNVHAVMACAARKTLAANEA